MIADQSVLFLLAKEIYAHHSTVQQLTNIPIYKKYWQRLVEKMSAFVEEFKEQSGIVCTEITLLEEKRPHLINPATPLNAIPYAIGRLDSERLPNSQPAGRSRATHEFKLI